MPLALVVENLEGVPETHRALYVEKDGKFQLDVTGVEDTSGLKSALQKERDTVKAERARAKELEEKFSGIDPEIVRNMMSKLDKDGEAALIAKGEIDQVISKRTEKLKTELQKQVDTANNQTKAERERAGKFMQRVLDNNIRAAATKAGLHTHAVDDALFRARSMFTVDDEGNAVQLDAEGNIILGKDGKNPFTPLEWLEDMKDKAPHWFPAGSSGGGAGGSKDPNIGGKKTMRRAVFNTLDAVERATAARSYQIVD